MNISQLATVSVAMLLAACATKTTVHMKQADLYLAESEARFEQGDWRTAISLVHRMEDHVTIAVQSNPIRTGLGGSELDLRPHLQDWENHGSRKLLSSLKRKSPEVAQAAFLEMRLQCVSCHTALGKSDISITNWPAP